MNTTQLETFIRVYENRSFSKTAASMYITHTAIIQQINLLEESLGVKLFERTHRGVTPTKAGDFFYKNATKIVNDWNTLLNDMHTFIDEKRIIYYSDFENSFLSPILHKYCAEHNDSMIIHQFNNNYFASKASFDILESMEYQVEGFQYLNFLRVYNIPICIGVSANHPLATKEMVTFSDLKPYTVITIKRGLISSVNKLNSDLKRYGIKTKEIMIYHESEMNKYMNDDYVFQIPKCWEHIFSNLKFLSGMWDYSIPYGYYYKEDASDSVMEFLDYVSNSINL